MSTFLQFYGAAQTVTGSMHLVTHDEHVFALDCGLFQGHRKESEERNRHWLIEPSSLEAVILSHAHIDHVGRLPKLVRDGFKGPVFATPATRDLATILLADSAHIQEEDAAWVNKKRAGKGEPPVVPLYSAQDATAALARFRTVPYGEPFCPVPGVVACFRDAGHMLGSAQIVLETSANGISGSVSSPRPPNPNSRFNPFCPVMQPLDRLPENGTHRLVFSGDLGRPHTPILRDPEPLVPCHTLICESTYGGRFHDKVGDPQDRATEIIHRTVARRGKIIVPAFAVGRAQTVIYGLHHLMREGRIPPIPVFLDSPLGVDASEIFKLHPECYDQAADTFNRATGDMLACPSCMLIRTREESMALNGDPRSMIIIAPSGMCEAGRILHHLKNNIEDPKNTIVIVGYSAPNTLGRRLAEKAEKVKIFGEEYVRRAEVEVINGFSGHADSNELCGWLGPQAKAIQRTFLVHGDPDQSDKLAGRMKDELRFAGLVRVPESGDRVKIS